MARKKPIAKPEVVQKETEVLKLRRGGLTWDLIAQRVGYNSPASAHAAYQRAMRRIVVEDVEAIRKVEADRLDMAQAAIWGKVISGEIPAVQTLVRIMERRAKLMGLDQPVRIQAEVVNYDGNSINAELTRIIELTNSRETLPMAAGASETEPAA